MGYGIIKAVIYTALTLCGVILTVIGRNIDGWSGVAVMLPGLGMFILMLYLYNRGK